jgi:methyltransferase
MSGQVATFPIATLIMPLLLLLVTGQRLLELVIARRNTQRLLASGGYEVGRSHYPLIVALHTAWLIAAWAWWIGGDALLYTWALIGYLLVQVLRIWVMRSLGRFWTTRIIVVPDAPLVQRGPYRLLRHPNYLVVALEIALLPLALGSWPLAVLFSLGNAAILWLRLRVEAASLKPRLSLT